MRPGDPTVPIIYEVDRIRDGRSLHHAPRGRPAARMSRSSPCPPPSRPRRRGSTIRSEMPDVPRPEALPHGAALADTVLKDAPAAVRRYWQRPRPIELRPVLLDHYLSNEKLEPVQRIWVRCQDEIARRSEPQRGRPRLSLGHDAARHLALCPWPVGLRRAGAGGEPRPCDVVPSPGAGVGLAALCAGQPVLLGWTRSHPRVAVLVATACWWPRSPRKA